jgi:hypothetical protein
MGGGCLEKQKARADQREQRKTKCKNCASHGVLSFRFGIKTAEAISPDLALSYPSGSPGDVEHPAFQ